MSFRTVKQVTWMLAAFLAAACTAPRESTLRIACRGVVPSLDYQRDFDYISDALLRNVYETLAEFRPDAGYASALATSWSNPSENVWRFELRRGVLFHDGRSFSAEDVRYTIERALAPNAPFRFKLRYVKAVRVKAEYVIEIETHRPAPLLLNELASVMIFPKGSGPELAGQAIGTGPYRVASFIPGQQLVLDASVRYWGKIPRWRSVVFRFAPDGHERVESLLDGATDVVEEPPPDEYDRIRGDERARLFERFGDDVTVIGINVADRANNPLSRAAARRAVAMALDRNRLVDEAIEGRAQPLWQLAPRVAFGYVADLPTEPRDLQRARTELREAGFPDGFRVPFAFTERDERIGRSVARQTADVGIVLDPKLVSWEELKKRHASHQPGASLFRYTFPSLDASEVLNDLHTRDQGLGLHNISDYSDPDLDSAIEAAAFEIVPEKRIRLLRRALEMALDARVVIPLCTASDVLAVRRGIEVGESTPHSLKAETFSSTAKTAER